MAMFLSSILDGISSFPTRKLLDPGWAERYIGGRGFASRILWDRGSPDVDPLAPENVLCLGAGPFSGTSLSMSSRIEVGTLSPYSGILGDCNACGGFAYRLKQIANTSTTIRRSTAWWESTGPAKSTWQWRPWVMFTIHWRCTSAPLPLEPVPFGEDAWLRRPCNSVRGLSTFPPQASVTILRGCPLVVSV